MLRDAALPRLQQGVTECWNGKVNGEKREAAARIALRLREAGFAAYFAGGCVRDRLLGRPIKDYDLVTSAIPSEIAGLFPEARGVGAHFGVLLVPAGEWRFEVATFRSDLSYLDGRRPEAVRYETDPRRDVERRDFTINGLLEDPSSGEVLDFVGGREDLVRGLIRAIGDPHRRFAEDHLRLLRAIRFASRLRFSIEPETWAALREHSPSITRVAPERIRDELTLILTEGGARLGMELLEGSGLLEIILPEVARMRGVEQPPEFHPEGDVWVHTLLVLDALGPCEPTLALAALLHDVGKPPTFTRDSRIRFNGHAELGARMAEDILRRLRYPAALVERVAANVASHMKFMDVPRMKESTFRRFVRQPHFEELLELHRVDLLGSLKPPAGYEQIKKRWQSLPVEALRPPALLTGNDLLAMGYLPGPQFRLMLEAVEEAQLEGKAVTPQQAREFVLRRWPPHQQQGVKPASK